MRELNFSRYPIRQPQETRGPLKVASAADIGNFTGWAVYNHGGGAQAIAANTRTKLSIDGATKIESQLPDDTGAL